MMLLTALFFAALALVRNAWGLVVVSACLLGVWTVLVAGEPVAATALVVALGVFLAVGSLRAAFDVVRSHLKAPRPVGCCQRQGGAGAASHGVTGFLRVLHRCVRRGLGGSGLRRGSRAIWLRR